MLRRGVLALSAATGVLLARGLDVTGALPGVHEPLAVRAAAADPWLNTLGVLAAVALGACAGTAVRRAPRATLLGLVLGQVGLLAGLEELTRLLQPLPEGNDAGLWLAVGVQALLSLLAVSTAGLVLRLVLARAADTPAVLPAGVPPVPEDGPRRRGFPRSGPARGPPWWSTPRPPFVPL